MHTLLTSGGLPVASFRDELRVSAEPSGLRLSSHGNKWSDAALRDGAWLRAWLQFEELADRGFAARSTDTWFVPAERLDSALRAGFTLPLLWSHWSPFRLHLWAGFEARGSGSPEFLIRACFRYGGSAVVLERCGRYLRRPSRDESSWLMDANTAAILDVVQTAAGHAPLTASGRSRLVSWLRDAGTEVGAELRGCLATGSAGAAEAVDRQEEGSWQIDSEGLSHAEFLRLSPPMLEASVAALYQHGGGRVALLPSGNGFGAVVLARFGRTVELAFVDTRPAASPIDLDAILAAESCIRATMPVAGLKSTVYSRLERDPAACASLNRRGIEVFGGRQFHERLRYRGVNPEVAATWQKYRCSTFADAGRVLFEVTC